MNKITRAIKEAKRVYVCGNGGSAATANHFVCDLVKACGIKAYSLCGNEALLTAIANDNGYENIFVDQFMVYAEPGDLLITISTSGKSPNILAVQSRAGEIGIAVEEFTVYGLDKETAENQHMMLAHHIRDELRGEIRS